MIKAAASLEPGDIIYVGTEYETISNVVEGSFSVRVHTSQGRQYQFDLTRPVKIYPVAPLKTCSMDRLYINELEHRVRHREETIERLRAFVEIVAAGNTDADVLAKQARRELNR